MEDKISVKKAELKELTYMANIMSESWKHGFKNLISESLLIELSEAERFYDIMKRIYKSDMGHLYIAYMGIKPVGELFWLSKGDDTAEVVSLHSLKSVWGKNVGYEMMVRAEKDMKEVGKKIYSYGLLRTT